MYVTVDKKALTANYQHNYRPNKLSPRQKKTWTYWFSVKMENCEHQTHRHKTTTIIIITNMLITKDDRLELTNMLLLFPYSNSFTFPNCHQKVSNSYGSLCYSATENHPSNHLLPLETLLHDGMELSIRSGLALSLNRWNKLWINCSEIELYTMTPFYIVLYCIVYWVEQQ